MADLEKSKLPNLSWDEDGFLVFLENFGNMYVA